MIQQDRLIRFTGKHYYIKMTLAIEQPHSKDIYNLDHQKMQRSIFVYSMFLNAVSMPT